MSKIATAARWSSAVAGGALVVALQTPPDVAASNAALWFQKITGHLPDWPTWTDTLGTVIGLALILVPLAAWVWKKWRPLKNGHWRPLNSPNVTAPAELQPPSEAAFVPKGIIAAAMRRRQLEASGFAPTTEELKEARRQATLEYVRLGGRKHDAATPPVPTPITFAGLIEAKDTPTQNHTAIRVIVRNQTDGNLTGLVARLTSADPELGSLDGAINLPLVIETKARLDRMRGPGKVPLPTQGFDLHAHSEEPIEVLWLHSKGALEGYITHEAGETTFLFCGSQDFHIEVTGAGPPITAIVRINVNDDDSQSWTAMFMPIAVGKA